MKTVFCKDWGIKNIVIEKIEPPQPKETEILIHTKAVSLSTPDWLIIEGKYTASPPFPFIPGREIAGVVKSVGAKVKKFEPGQRVMAWVEKGGLAEQVTVPEKQAFLVSERMDFATAASFFLPYTMAYLGLNHKTKVKPGETILVHGGGSSMGLAAIDLAQSLGANVITSANFETKLQQAKAMGASQLIDLQIDDFNEKAKEYTKGKGFKLIYDVLGGDKFDPLLRCIATNGRWILVGFAGGKIPSLALNRLLFRNADLVSLWWYNYLYSENDLLRRVMADLMRYYNEGIIKPLILDNQQFSLSKSKKAWELIAERKNIGKVIIKL